MHPPLVYPVHDTGWEQTRCRQPGQK